MWYSVVGAHDFLLASFSSPDGPRPAYLALDGRAADGGLRILARRRMMTHGWRIWWEIGHRHVLPGATSTRWFIL